MSADLPDLGPLPKAAHMWREDVPVRAGPLLSPLFTAAQLEAERARTYALGRAAGVAAGVSARAVMQQALEALRHGVKAINHLGGAKEAMPLHEAIAALASPTPPAEPLTGIGEMAAMGHYKRGYEEALNDCIRNGLTWARSMFANNAAHIAPPAEPAESVAYKVYHPKNPRCFYLATELPQPTRTDTGEPDEYYGGKAVPLYAAPPQAAAEPVVWNVINPAGKIVGTEKDAVHGWARLGGFKLTVEGLLGLHEQGWRVVPAAPPQAAQPPAEWVQKVCRYLSDTLASGTENERAVARTIMHLLPLDSIAAPQPVQAQAEWVSVTDSLPPSGKTVLACYTNRAGNVRRIRAEWVAEKSREANSDDSDIGVYDEATDTFYDPPGWYEKIDNWGDYSSVAVVEGEVTHWMPLPPAPTGPAPAKDAPHG